MSTHPPKIFTIGIAADTKLAIPGNNSHFTYKISVKYKGGELSLQYESQDKDNLISLLDLIGLLCNVQFSKEGFPASILGDIKVERFLVAYQSGKESNLTIAVSLHSTLGIFSTAIGIDLTYTSGGGTTGFGGVLKFTENQQFAFRLFEKNKHAYISANYLYKGGSLNIRQLAKGIADTEFTRALPNIDLNVTDASAYIVYSKNTGTNPSSRFAIGMGAGLGNTFSLADLPLVGKLLEDKGTFKIERIAVSYASAAFDAEEVKNIKATQQNLPIPTVITEGFGLLVAIKTGEEVQEYSLSPKLAQPSLKQLTNTGTTTPGDKKDTNSAANALLAVQTQGSAKWFNTDYKLGPFHFQRVGLDFRDGVIILLIDAQFSLSVISLQLMGLGFGFKLKWPPDMPPDFYLDGLGVSYKKDPIEISGIFLRVNSGNKDKLEFYGAAMLKLSTFAVAALGGYSQTKIYKEKDPAMRQMLLAAENKHPKGSEAYQQAKEASNAALQYETRHSLFIYGIYFGPIGGPAFFFVTGLAAGFGYNRRIRTPKIEEVKDFPLVSAVLSSDKDKGINQVLTDLIEKNWIPDSPGDYWFAIGIKFTSFKIVDSFVLAIVQFGTRTEFTILGLSILAWPSKEMAIAYAELAIKASFSPSADLISVEAMLTENSFLFHKSCRLTGGFAFYAWVSGPHEGDFVITLGGYHPEFAIPSHYPRVDRLGLNWKLDDKLLIKGGTYYALTSGGIMAGGSLEIAFDLGFLKASIAVWVDMLMAWAPFRYKLGVGIIVKIQANIELGLFDVHFDLEMGAQLTLWGPPFAGTVKVNWKIYSFSISFGSTPDAANASLSWVDFRKQFLPSSKNAVGKEEYRAAEIMVASGIIKENKATDKQKELIVVNPHSLSVKIELPLPATIVTMAEEELPNETKMQAGNNQLTYADRNTTLGIRPMQQESLSSTVNIVFTGPSADCFYSSVQAAALPEALWSPEKLQDGNDKPPQPKVLPNAIKGILIRVKEELYTGIVKMNVQGNFETAAGKMLRGDKELQTGIDNNIFTGSIKVAAAAFLEDNAERTSILIAATRAQGLELPRINNNAVKHWINELDGEPVIVITGGQPQYKKN